MPCTFCKTRYWPDTLPHAGKHEQLVPTKAVLINGLATLAHALWHTFAGIKPHASTKTQRA
jgi:hypothetical protein